MVLDESSCAGALCDLHLLAVTGGKERTASQFHELLASSGFRLLEIRTLPSAVSLLVAELS